MPFLTKSKRVQFLLAVGIGQFLMGFSYVVTPTKSRSQGFAWLPLDVGPDDLGWIPILIGLTVIVLAIYSTRCRRLQTWAFALAGIPWALWAAIFAVAQILGAHPTGHASALSYGCMVALLVVVAGWPDPVEDSAKKIIEEARRV